jgi:hypothetical protein
MTSLINPTNIDGSYPIAGQDNDSQGFRDNFTNIKNNLTTAQSELTDLQGKAILKSALANSTLDNDMAYTKLTRPQLNAYSETFFEAATGSGTISLNYDLGNVQRITTSGGVSLGIDNWPESGQVGKLKLWFKVLDHTTASLTLPAACTIGFPANLAGAVFSSGAATYTITFAADGDYFYDFMTVDGGTSIYIKQA